MPGLVGLGFITGLFGYNVFYYGVTQVQGGNWGFWDLLIPANWTSAVAATPRDGQSSGGSAGTTKVPASVPLIGGDTVPTS